jgi:hypothetical protein
LRNSGQGWSYGDVTILRSMIGIGTALLAAFSVVEAIEGAQTLPGPRIGHSLVYDINARAVVLLDGYSWIRAVSPAEPPLTTEVWQWNGGAWNRQAHAAGPASSTMGRAAFDAARNKTIRFGGALRNGTGFDWPTDTWEWNGTAWTRIATNGPPGRAAPSGPDARPVPL